jgi:hypothetical protein
MYVCFSSRDVLIRYPISPRSRHPNFSDGKCNNPQVFTTQAEQASQTQEGNSNDANFVASETHISLKIPCSVTYTMSLNNENNILTFIRLLKVSENSMLRRIYGPKTEVVTGWRKLHNEDLHNLHL